MKKLSSLLVISTSEDLLTDLFIIFCNASDHDRGYDYYEDNYHEINYIV